MMSKDFQDILRAFNAHKVKYLVIGGFAFGVHLEPRTTKDIDLWIRTDKENAKAVFQALAEFGAPIAGMTPDDFMDGTIFQMGQPPERIRHTSAGLQGWILTAHGNAALRGLSTRILRRLSFRKTI